MANESVIAVENLRKVYGQLVAVSDISFNVSRGEIFGMVGRNGAGKTTTIECLEGLRVPDGGSVSVLGLSPTKGGYRLKNKIGTQLQESALHDRIRVGEAIELFASLYPTCVDGRKLAARLGIEEKWNSPFAKLSGGQKTRLFIALALINDPEMVFLDELTTGLDPHARRDMWDLVLDIRERGKTVFLTTHYMEEAERLCDRVLIIHHGKIVALDTPGNLIENLDTEMRVSFVCEGDPPVGKLSELEGVEEVKSLGEKTVVRGRGDALLGDVVRVIERSGCGLKSFESEQATLEDVFLKLTGEEVGSDERVS
jgi:ABC-2 type transport system ATP-binding protein